MTMTDRYPVSDVIYLQGPKGFLRRREQAELPLLRAGSVFVVGGESGFELLPSNIRLDGTEPILHQNTRLFVIETADRTLNVTVEIPTASATSRYAAQISVRSRVYDPVQVAETLGSDLVEVIRASMSDHLGGLSPQLGENQAVARQLIAAHVRARFDIEPPNVRGIDLTILDVEVSPPEEWSAFNKTMESMDRAHREAERKLAYELHEQQRENKRLKHERERELAELRQQLDRVELFKPAIEDESLAELLAHDKGEKSISDITARRDAIADDERDRVERKEARMMGLLAKAMSSENIEDVVLLDRVTMKALGDYFEVDQADQPAAPEIEQSSNYGSEGEDEEWQE